MPCKTPPKHVAHYVTSTFSQVSQLREKLEAVSGQRTRMAVALALAKDKLAKAELDVKVLRRGSCDVCVLRDCSEVCVKR